MSAVTPSPREDAPPSGKLDQAYRLYRKRIARCRTENQFNRIHIAVENYMTPAEMRYFDAALAEDPPDAPSREWIARVHRLMPLRKVRPVEFERRGLVKGATRYTAAVGSPGQKTLILAFGGAFNRLMLPMPCWLDCLNPAFYDMIVLRDLSRRLFGMGIHGLGSNFFEALAALRKHVDPASIATRSPWARAPADCPRCWQRSCSRWTEGSRSEASICRRWRADSEPTASTTRPTPRCSRRDRIRFPRSFSSTAAITPSMRPLRMRCTSACLHGCGR